MSAVLSADRLYRYSLRRYLGGDGCGDVAFVMLNPSTADEFDDDPTIRRCMGFARRWGAGRLDVVNLFAYRATDPRTLRDAPDPIGPDNDAAILSACVNADIAVLAWGAHGHLRGRDRYVLEMLRDVGVVPQALALTKSGAPRHPLYLRGDVMPVPYEERAA